MLRIKAAEWEKYERARETAIRTELQEKFASLQDGYGQPLADRMLEAARMLDRLAREGLTEEQDSLLLSAAIEAFCREISAGLSITTNPESGFIGVETRFDCRDPRRGRRTDRLPALARGVDGQGRGTRRHDGDLRTGWECSPSPTRPRDVVPQYGRPPELFPPISPARPPSSAALKDIDAASRVEASFRHFDDAGKFFSGEVLVPGGPFTAGAVARDKRAARKEAPRQADTPDLYIDLYPVTNALYEMYLEDTKAQDLPEYWDNPQYNQPEQPVIGVSYDDAVRFASWLSAQLGVVKRLPTEDEWEKAARGGRDVIYPWGDQSPTDGVRANYNGNGRFSSTSPVGSFEAGKNAYGLFDMAGNVWEWTSTSRAGTGSLIVKGGSWMDGPADLRVSNRREVDPSKGYVDVGFRLVREVTHE